MLLDRKSGRVVMVMDDRRAAVPLPPGLAGLALREIPADGRFSRQGTDAVAGHACVVWQVALPHGDSAVWGCVGVSAAVYAKRPGGERPA